MEVSKYGVCPVYSIICWQICPKLLHLLCESLFPSLLAFVRIPTFYVYFAYCSPRNNSLKPILYTNKYFPDSQIVVFITKVSSDDIILLPVLFISRIFSFKIHSLEIRSFAFFFPLQLHWYTSGHET